MLHMVDVIAPENVVIDVEATCKKHAILEAAKLLAASSGLAESTIFMALMAREKLGSTGFGHGTAAPHVRLSGIETTHAAFIRLAHAVDFEASDDLPVDLICAIVGPEGSTTKPFEALVSACRALRDQEAVARLRKADNAFDLYVILAEEA